MITIQGDVVVVLPDDVPVPPGAIVVEAPPEFDENPSAFRARDGKLVRLTDEEFAARRRSDIPRLSADDLRRLKEALDAGRI